MSERQEGWYWVRLEADHPWEVAKLSDSQMEGIEDMWAVVGQRIPTPDEPWQMVPLSVTEQIIDASELEGDHAHGIHRHDIGACWQAMLAAAPEP